MVLILSSMGMRLVENPKKKKLNNKIDLERQL